MKTYIIYNLMFYLEFEKNRHTFQPHSRKNYKSKKNDDNDTTCCNEDWYPPRTKYLKTNKNNINDFTNHILWIPSEKFELQCSNN